MGKSKENIQFRILYFIGIISIVLGHCAGGSITILDSWFPRFSFQLALFVFCSGYFFIKNKDISLFQFLKKILFKFIIPLYAWNVFYGIIITILHKFGFTFGDALSFDSLILLPLYNGHQFVFTLAAWFIPPLLICQILNYFTIKIIGDRKRIYIVHFVISLLLGFLGVHLAIKGFNHHWGLLLCKTLYFIPFFSLGILYRTNIEKYDRVSNVMYFFALFFITLIVIYVFGGVTGYTPSWCKNFDNFYRPFIVGILGIAFWLRVSKILEPSLKDSKIVSLVSKNTYSIMIHHFMGFFLLNTAWFISSKLFAFIEHFDAASYKSTIYYFYLPKGLIQFRILYAVFGILFSLLIAFITKKIKEYILTHFINKKAN